MEGSQHVEQMLRERGIDRKWTDLAEREPDWTETHDDGTRHFIKQIPEFENRWLRVVINVTVMPNRRVTAFLDRRLRRTHEGKD